MAHPEILSAEIFPIICQSLPQKSISALARTARALQDPALRELWRSITKFSHLLFPFGLSVDRTGKKICFADAPTSRQWDRFRFYAKYIRNLEIGGDNDYQLSCLSILLHHQPLLPSLESLRVSSWWSGPAIATLPMFFVPSIQKFEITARQDDFLAVVSLIPTLARTAPALQHLAISVPLTGRWELTISPSFFQNLHSINIPLTGLQVQAILSHLSTLPALSRIRFYITDSARISGTGAKFLFPAARDLSIHSKFGDNPIYLMAMTWFDNLNSLHIDCDNYQMGDQFLFMAISISCGQFLKQIYIAGKRQDPRPMKFSTLYPLFKFTHLRSFSLTTKALYPTDEDIQDIAKSWPNLEEFYMHPTFHHADVPPDPPPLTGLLLLIEKCTRLVLISIAVDAMDIPNLTIPISRPRLVIKIRPEDSTIDSPRLLAEFLSLILPQAGIEIHNDGSEDYSLWQEAVSFREYFIKGRQEGEQRAIKRIQELQMALVEGRLENARLRALHES